MRRPLSSWKNAGVDSQSAKASSIQKSRETPGTLMFAATASTPPACKKAKSVTHVSGTKCHLCLGPLTLHFLNYRFPGG